VARITEDETRKIRELIGEGLTAAEIASKVGRNVETVRRVARDAGLKLTSRKPSNPSFGTVRPGKVSAVSARAPMGSLVQRQREAKMPAITIRLDDDANQILTKAAAHRHTTIERLCENVLMGTAFLGDINTQTAKVQRFRELGAKEKLSAHMSAMRQARTDKDSKNREIACEPGQPGEV
jgi:hypothetical protein